MSEIYSVGRVVVFTAALVAGCSTVEITDDRRTESDDFNGVWIGKISQEKNIQLADALWSQAVFDCKTINADVELRVSDGALEGIAEFEKQVVFSANINDSGRFYSDVRRDSEYLNQGRSRFGAKEFHVFKGVIDPVNRTVESVYISALGDVSQGGCSYNIDFRLVGDS